MLPLYYSPTVDVTINLQLVAVVKSKKSYRYINKLRSNNGDFYVAYGPSFLEREVRVGQIVKLRGKIEGQNYFEGETRQVIGKYEILGIVVGAKAKPSESPKQILLFDINEQISREEILKLNEEIKKEENALKEKSTILRSKIIDYERKYNKFFKT